jgi:hypothetical protein
MSFDIGIGSTINVPSLAMGILSRILRLEIWGHLVALCGVSIETLITWSSINGCGADSLSIRSQNWPPDWGEIFDEHSW